MFCILLLFIALQPLFIPQDSAHTPGNLN